MFVALVYAVAIRSAERITDAEDNRIEHGERAGWLTPIPVESKRQGVRGKTTTRRASNKGCLTMGLGEYLALLDWTGRQIRKDKRGAMPSDLEPLFERLGISTELWVDCVLNFRKWFRSNVGHPRSMDRLDSKVRRPRWITAMDHSASVVIIIHGRYDACTMARSSDPKSAIAASESNEDVAE